MNIQIKKLHPDAVLPQYAHGPVEDSGMDLSAVEDVVLRPFVPTLVKTGIAIELPRYVEAQVRSRGSMALKYGIQVLNSPGTVDPGYRGDIGVILCWNGYNPQTHKADENDILSVEGNVYLVKKGDRIAQLVVSRYEPVAWCEVLGPLTNSFRGTGAYGSTGLNSLDTHNQ